MDFIMILAILLFIYFIVQVFVFIHYQLKLEKGIINRNELLKKMFFFNKSLPIIMILYISWLFFPSFLKGEINIGYKGTYFYTISFFQDPIFFTIISLTTLFLIILSIYFIIFVKWNFTTEGNINKNSIDENKNNKKKNKFSLLNPVFLFRLIFMFIIIYGYYKYTQFQLSYLLIGFLSVGFFALMFWMFMYFFFFREKNIQN